MSVTISWAEPDSWYRGSRWLCSSVAMHGHGCHSSTGELTASPTHRQRWMWTGNLHQWRTVPCGVSPIRGVHRYIGDSTRISGPIESKCKRLFVLFVVLNSSIHFLFYLLCMEAKMVSLDCPHSTSHSFCEAATKTFFSLHMAMCKLKWPKECEQTP